MTVELALGEVQALAQKATRGAGRAVGVAEEAGRAVRWLSARGYDGAGALDALLRATDGWSAEALRLHADKHGEGMCPLTLGAYISDTGEVPVSETEPVFAPILLAPALAFVAGAGRVVLEMREAEMHVSAYALTGPEPFHDPIRVRLARSDAPMPAPRLRTRVEEEQATLESLLRFAARTYAPATEASRATGAGAGTSDRD